MVNDYIRREDAVDAIGEEYVPRTDFERGMVSQMSCDKAKIKAMPPADVVQVVRCENCVHWSDSNQCERPELAGNRWHDDKYFETLPDDFCSYGERKGE